jgi:transcriptional regulator with XRE-family HTH domain
MSVSSTQRFGVGVELRKARERAGLSRQQLAAHARCSVGSISQFEHGARPARSPTLRRVWAVLATFDVDRDAA